MEHLGIITNWLEAYAKGEVFREAVVEQLSDVLVVGPAHEPAEEKDIASFQKSLSTILDAFDERRLELDEAARKIRALDMNRPQLKEGHLASSSV